MVFATPLMLLALFTLPALWWLLRVTPKKPVLEIFPPLRLLLTIINRQETPSKTPWWLLLLRLLIATFIILALASPSLNNHSITLTGTQPLAIVMDNSFASAKNLEERKNIANALLDQAESLHKNVYIIATADSDVQDFLPKTVYEAKEYLKNIQPRPLFAKRALMVEKLLNTVKDQNIDLAILSDGLKSPDDDVLFQNINSAKISSLFWFQGKIDNLMGITALKQESGAIAVDVIRANPNGEGNFLITAYDKKGHPLDKTNAHFADMETTSVAAFNLPLEIRNDVQWVSFDSDKNIATTYLADHSNRVYRVALLAQNIQQMTQPLLEPLYYVTKALDNDFEIITAGSGAFSEDVDKLLAQNPSSFILGDVANIPQDTEQKLLNFVKNGGILIRFAGEKLANSDNADQLLPVALRKSERKLGGVMSWASPQKLSPFAENSVFANLPFPKDVTVSRQILPEPTANLSEKTWVSLADGTPLVTANSFGSGKIIFIHTAPDPSWSNLPLSHFFVLMLKTLIERGSVVEVNNNTQNTASQIAKPTLSKQPFRVLNIYGQLEEPASYVMPLLLNNNANEENSLPSFKNPSFKNPPGLYGSEQNLTSINLLNQNFEFLPIKLPNFTMQSHVFSYDTKMQIQLSGYFLALALILFALDSLLILTFSKVFTNKRRFNSFFFIALACVVFWHLGAPDLSFAQPAKTPQNIENQMIQSAGTTRLAYVITGNTTLDDTSQRGLEALSQFIESRSTISPGSVIGLNLDQDELAFYQLIYWPIDTKSTMPSQKAIEKINAFMQQGGTVLFDTRDQIESGLNFENTTTPNTQRLRDILSGLNIPPLEKAPSNHVIARSFYIMPDFPGRFRGSPLWIEALNTSQDQQSLTYFGDGVSSILITANDFAGAWAYDGKGGWQYPLVPDDPMQRLYAFRGGLNIVMYMLTGNYKADQVHASELLKRLGKENSQ